MKRGAVISEDGLYRYLLFRKWDDSKPNVVFIGLNPSTADAKKDDHTIRKLIGFCNRWEYGGFYILNLFAYRSKDPKKLKSIPLDIAIGPDNNRWLKSYIITADLIICMWGNNAKMYFNQRSAIMRILRKHPEKLKCFCMTKDGHPSHPLRLGYDTIPIKFG